MKEAINFTEYEYRLVFKAASLLKISVRDFVKQSVSKETDRLVNQAEASQSQAEIKVIRLRK